MLSRLLRYAPVAADSDPAVGVLDVGCGQLGLGCVFDGARFAGQDVDFAGPVTRAMFGVRAGTRRFPWADGAFDTVVCVDPLERIAPAERAAFVAECARVAARRLLISCATDAAECTRRIRAADRGRTGAAVRGRGLPDEALGPGQPAAELAGDVRRPGHPLRVGGRQGMRIAP